MSSTYTVKNNDSVGSMLLDAKKSDKELTYRTFAKVTKNIKVGDTITIPKSKKHAGSTSAEPKEGKCGNEFTYHPIGRNATATSVSCAVNGKSSPSLEADKTYINEQEKLEKSQTGSLDITLAGKKTSVIPNLGEVKDKIGRHKDIKVKIIIADEEAMTPIVNINNEFRSPDQQATMTAEEMYVSQTIRQSHIQTLADLGIHVNATEKHSMVVVELPPNMHLDTGIFNIDDMKDEVVEKFTQAMAIAMAPGNKEGASKFITELFTLGLFPGQEKRAFWKQMGLKGKFVISIEKGVRVVQFYPTTHFTAAWKAGATKAEQKKLKKSLVQYNKKYPLGQTEFAKQLKQAIPFLVKVKVGYLEKFISGLSRGGTLISILIIGGTDTAKWAIDEQSQNVDLWAIWGVAIASGLAATAAYNITAAVTALLLAPTIFAGSVVITVGAGVLASVWVAYEVATLITEHKFKENLIDWLRTMEIGEERSILNQSLSLESLSLGGL